MFSIISSSAMPASNPNIDSTLDMMSGQGWTLSNYVEKTVVLVDLYKGRLTSIERRIKELQKDNLYEMNQDYERKNNAIIVAIQEHPEPEQCDRYLSHPNPGLKMIQRGLQQVDDLEDEKRGLENEMGGMCRDIEELKKDNEDALALACASARFSIPAPAPNTEINDNDGAASLEGDMMAEMLQGDLDKLKEEKDQVEEEKVGLQQALNKIGEKLRAMKETTRTEALAYQRTVGERNTTINDLNNKLAIFGDNPNSIQDELRNERGKVTDLEGKLVVAAKTIDELKGAVATFENKKTEIKKQIDDFMVGGRYFIKERDDLKTAVTHQHNRADTAEETIRTKQEIIASLEARSSELYDAGTSLHSEYNKAVANLNNERTRADTAQSQLDTRELEKLKYDSKMQDLTSQISNARKETITAQSDIKSFERPAKN